MELKVVCNCGQKYKFDVEPVNGRMPFTVQCPACGVDGTAAANTLLNQKPGPQPIVLSAIGAPETANPPVLEPSAPPPLQSGLRINRPPPIAASAVAAPAMAGRSAPAIAPMRTLAAPKPKKTENYSLGMGLVGAFIGATLGAGLMYGFYAGTGFRFPLMGTVIGIVSGFGARLLAKGTDSTLGALAAVLAVAANGATLYFMFGEFSATYAISLAVGGYFAYRIAS